MPLIEYEPGHHFPGVAGRTADESSPAWPAPKRAAKGAPNVLFIVLDDTGFGQLGCFGSPIDDAEPRRARRRTVCGTTTCTPPRCARRAARASSPAATTTATPWPASPSSPPAFPATTATCRSRTAILSEILLAQGYNTYMVGKWHLIPSSQESGAGPYDRWPLGRGFERFYGFLGGDTSQWNPDLVYDNHQVDPPATPEEGYHLTPDLVDKAVEFIADAKQVDPDKPFYLHFCPGATHAPHHVPKEWADKYAGQVRRRLGRLPHPHLRPPEGARRRAGRLRAVPPRPRRAGLGFALRRPAPPVRPRDGGVRRVPEPHRPPHRPPHRVPAHASVSSTTP